MIDDLAGVPLIIALVELLKKFGVSDKLLPIADLVFGISYSIGKSGAVTFDTVLMGITIGLTAAGLYRSQKVLRGND
jgi:hypothetical protein